MLAFVGQREATCIWLTGGVMILKLPCEMREIDQWPMCRLGLYEFKM